MKNVSIIFFFILSKLLASAQTINEKSIWAATDIPNKFVKGDDSLVHFIKQNFKVCKNSKLPEKVVVYFVIEPDSSITEFKFISQNEPHLKNDVVEMFTILPKWIPGIQYGKAVRSARLLLFKCDKGQVILPPYERPGINRKN